MFQKIPQRNLEFFSIHNHLVDKNSRKFAYLKPSYDFTNFELEIKTKVDDFFKFLKIQNFLKFSENVN